MIVPPDYEPQFRWHPAIIDAFNDANFFIKFHATDQFGSEVELDLMKQQEHMINFSETTTQKQKERLEKEFKGCYQLDHRIIRLVARIYDNEPVVDYWVHVNYGHTEDSNPIYTREHTLLNLPNGLSKTLDNPNPRGKPVAHGQGLPVCFFAWDFTQGNFSDVNTRFKKLNFTSESFLPPFSFKAGTFPELPEWIEDSALACLDIAQSESGFTPPFEETKYTPAYPGMTGDQAQFGAYHLLPEFYSDGYRYSSWRDQLYHEGCRPGRFLNKDATRATEEQWPDTVLHSNGWFHEHSRGSHWIEHTSKNEPWKDKGARTKDGNIWTFWDDQHWSLNALAQFATAYDDPGAKMLMEDVAEGWLWSNPAENKGTSHHKPGAARARGRVLEAGTAIFHSVEGEQRDRVGVRVNKRFENQYKPFNVAIESNASPIIGRKDGYAVWEHALWVKGLVAAYSILTDENKQKCIEMTEYISKWVLGGFKRYEDGWYIPYIIDYEGNYSTTPSKGLSRWCFPCIQVLNKYFQSGLSPEVTDKLSQIMEQMSNDKYPPYGGGWPDSTRWKLFGEM